jgi:uncharacterized damage-inducible protein DinB
MSTLRGWQFEQLKHDVRILEFMIGNTSTAKMSNQREKPDGWTASEVIGHLLDCERLFLQRAKLVMEKDMPDLPFPPQNEEVKKGCYNDRDPKEIFNQWKTEREAYLDYLSALPDASWERAGKHPKYDPLSLNDQLLLATRHTLQHMEQIVRILTK